MKEITLDLKQQLYEYCLNILQQRIQVSQSLMNAAQAAANEEEKSSVGDKYETARSMNQLDREMHAKQLLQHQKELERLKQVNWKQQSSTVQPGSLIVCSDLLIFIAAGIGTIGWEQQQVIILSPSAPMATALTGKKAGDSVQVKHQTYQIQKIL